ncbi:MAG: fibronectin type III domain-containing protein, partial [Negativicutes bacterium]
MKIKKFIGTFKFKTSNAKKVFGIHRYFIHKLKTFKIKSLRPVLAGILIFIMVVQIFQPGPRDNAYSATYTFAQSSWAGGADTGSSPGTNYPEHPAGQTGWNKYYSASSTINFANASALTLTTSTYSYTDDATTSTTGGYPVAGGGFANGTTNSSQYVAGANSTANISLASTVTNLNQFDSPIAAPPVIISNATGNIVNIRIVGSYAYVLNGTSNVPYRYSITNNSWDSFVAAPANAGAIAVDSNYIYLLGQNGGNGLWRHTLANTTTAWESFPVLPSALGQSMSIEVTNLNIYVVSGMSTNVFVHTIADTSSAWDTFSPLPAGTLTGADLAVDGSMIYITRGGTTTSTYRHTLANTSTAWDEYPALPANVGAGGGMTVDSNYLYVSQGAGGAGFYRHTLLDTTSAWESFGTGLSTIYGGRPMVDSQYAYVLQGGPNLAFYRHTLANTSSVWESFKTFPATVNGGMAIDSSNNNIYVLRSYSSPNIYRHTLANTSSNWVGQVTYPDLPGNVGGGGSAIVDANYLYVAQGGARNVYRHTLLNTTDPWEQYTVAPYNIAAGSNLVLDNNYLYLPTVSALLRHTLADISSAWEASGGSMTAGLGGGLAVDSQYAYVLGGGAGTSFKRQPLATFSAASSETYNIPASANNQGMHVLVDSNYVYASRGTTGAQVYRHTVADATSPWDTFSTTGLLTFYDGNHIALDNNYIYVTPGSAQLNFSRHALTNTSTAWENYVTTNFGGVSFGGGVRVDSNYIYVLGGNGHGFYRHPLALTGAWTVLPSVPSFVSTGGFLTEDSSGNNLYVVHGNATPYVSRFIVNQTVYSASGDWTSAAIKLNASHLNTISWASSTPNAAGASAVRIQIATSADNSTWSGWSGPDGTNLTYYTSSPAAIPANTGAVYVKYKVFLQTANTTVTPSLSDVTFNYDQYNPSGTIVSSLYDSGDSQNVFSDVRWTGSSSTVATFSFQIRTGASSSTILTNPWVGPDGTANTWFTTAGGSTMPASVKDSVADRFFQYRARFDSLDGSAAPVLNSVTEIYVVNAPPEVRNVTATQNSDGSVSISYETRSSDMATDTGSIGVVTPSFQYCAGGTSCTTITALSANATSSKAVDGVAWTPYSLTWYPSTDSPNVYDTAAKVKVWVDDLQLANNTANSSSIAFTLDTTPPASATIRVDASSTPATVHLTETDPSTPITMRFAATAGDLAAATYIPFSSTASYTFPANPGTVYVQFKDAFQNVTNPAIYYATTPDSVSNFIVQDTSNLLNGQTDYREFLAWRVVNQPGPGFGAYQIYRSTDNINWSLVNTVTDRSINYFTDNTAPPLTSVYYKVLTTDSSGNVSFNSASVQVRADGVQNFQEGGGGSGVGPVISSITTSTPSASIITITWNTDTLSNSQVGYSTTPGIFGNSITVASMVNNAAGSGEHSVILSNLTPDTTYYFSVKSTDSNGSFTTDDNSSNGYVFHTTPGPTITSGPTAATVLNNSATITWITSLAANATIFYSTVQNMSVASSTADLAAFNINHSLTLTGLQPSQNYFYYVLSADVAGNQVFDKNIQNGVAYYYSFYTTNDSVAPVINNAIAAVNTTTASISWSTNELANSQINYGLTVGYGSSTTLDATLTTQHSVNLQNLTPNQT